MNSPSVLKSQLDSYLHSTKVELRKSVQQELILISEADKQKKSELIQKHLQEKLNNQSGYWACYQPLSSEPKINWQQISTKISWCFPVIENEILYFKKEVSEFTKNSLGFLEPVDGERISTSELTGFIVPGVAFGHSGHRLGRGRGFYDQTLKNIKGTVIGVCFEIAFKNSVPFEEHDLKCQMIITENQSVVIEGVNSWN